MLDYQKSLSNHLLVIGRYASVCKYCGLAQAFIYWLLLVSLFFVSLLNEFGMKHEQKWGVQWNLSKEDTIKTQLAVLYREVSLIQR